jgi:hypothetical protein
MAGEPRGQFDVTKLEAIETDPAGDEHSTYILNAGEQFSLRATFEGTGAQWDSMERSGFKAVLRFYAESIGPGPEQSWGPKMITLGPASQHKTDGEYRVDSDPISISQSGIYRCGVAVTFKTDSDNYWWGVLGFNDECMLQIHWLEELG